MSRLCQSTSILLLLGRGLGTLDSVENYSTFTVRGLERAKRATACRFGSLSYSSLADILLGGAARHLVSQLRNAFLPADPSKYKELN